MQTTYRPTDMVHPTRLCAILGARPLRCAQAVSELRGERSYIISKAIVLCVKYRIQILLRRATHFVSIPIEIPPLYGGISIVLL